MVMTSKPKLNRPNGRAQESQDRKKHAKFDKMSSLLTVFVDYRGLVHQAFLPQSRTVNKEYYLEVMCRLQEAIWRKRPELWKNNSWLLHHDNAPTHSSLLVRDFLAKNNTIMPQPPYSPDLAPCDFFLFPKLKKPMKGRRFVNDWGDKECIAGRAQGSRIGKSVGTSVLFLRGITLKGTT